MVGNAGPFVGGPAVSIFSKSPIAGTGNVVYESGIGPYYRDLYFQKYVKLDLPRPGIISPISGSRSRPRI